MVHWMKMTFISGALLTMSATTSAARYELQEGEQNELCRDYVTALNAVHRSMPMACERDFPAVFTKFSKPRWEPMEPRAQSMGFYRELYDIKERVEDKESSTDELWLHVRKMVLEPAIEYGLLDLAKTRLDIDASGTAKTVVRIREHLGVGDCDPESDAWYREELGPPPSQYRYYVIDDNTGKPDPLYGTVSLVGEDHDLFFYQGQIYIDSFFGISLKNKKAHMDEFPFLSEQDPEGYLSVAELGSGSPKQLGAKTLCVVKVFYELKEKTEIDPHRELGQDI